MLTVSVVLEGSCLKVDTIFSMTLESFGATSKEKQLSIWFSLVSVSLLKRNCEATWRRCRQVAAPASQK